MLLFTLHTHTHRLPKSSTHSQAFLTIRISSAHSLIRCIFSFSFIFSTLLSLSNPPFTFLPLHFFFLFLSHSLLNHPLSLFPYILSTYLSSSRVRLIFVHLWFCSSVFFSFISLCHSSWSKSKRFIWHFFTIQNSIQFLLSDFLVSISCVNTVNIIWILWVSPGRMVTLDRVVVGSNPAFAMGDKKPTVLAAKYETRRNIIEIKDANKLHTNYQCCVI